MYTFLDDNYGHSNSDDAVMTTVKRITMADDDDVKDDDVDDVDDIVMIIIIIIITKLTEIQ